MDHHSTTTSDELRFKEIEHKFIVEAPFDLEAFRRQLSALGPAKVNAISVRDSSSPRAAESGASCSDIASTRKCTS
jgi:hypothetical protein